MIENRNPDYFTEASVDPVAEEDEEALDCLNRALASNPLTTDALITAEVHDGQVVLRGDVPASDVRVAAEDVAWGIPGVHAVVNQITSPNRNGKG